MDFISEKINVMVGKLAQWSLISEKEIEFYYVECNEYKKNNLPPDENAGWELFPKGGRAGGVDHHYWLHMKLAAQPEERNRELRFSLKTGREGQWDLKNPQCTVYINGKTQQALDTNHTWLPLEFNVDYDIYIYLYSGMIGGYFDVIPSVQVVDLAIEELFYDVNVPYLCMKELSEKSTDYIKTRDCLNKVLINLDLRDVYSKEFYESIEKTKRVLKEEFYEKLCGHSEGLLSVIGHTHIDIAWHWTVAQTKEKAQRSFATVLNMMRRYDDYLFMSSQPQLYQYVKENDPELYEEIKERVREGRWEPEGGMWLEPDTNLISGESLVRQILYGKRFMLEEFGVDCKILWLPDVFGYSGALPQIMKKSGIDYFFTSKLGWNETNQMPDDVMIWEGIDGSQVLANLLWAYAQHIEPEYLKKTWEDFKNKSYTQNVLMTFGYGDGGGGPTYDSMENYKRLKNGLPGMPVVKIEKPSEYFKKLEKDFRKNAEALKYTPKWTGEMYFEMHRGTYTSMAKNKKNNRRSEMTYLTAETISVMDMLLLGGNYPQETLAKNQLNILLNQFHDIIPGSAIKEVYDVTDAEYERILADGANVINEGLKNIKKNIRTDGGILVHNFTPFIQSDYVEVDGKKYFAENVPAHGWKVVREEAAVNPIRVTAHSIENNWIKITFNDKYHIISVFDKEADREVIAEHAEANVLEIFEDYPRKYDAWEITSYYNQKMWVADDVSAVELLENGIRIKRKYQKSEIVQEIVLKEHSKRIDFITIVDWKEDHVLMKAAFPVDVHSETATYDIQFGNLKRPTTRNTSWDRARFEVSAQKWADLSECGYGVSILNDCKYGYSIEDNIMKISLLKAATYPNTVADREIHQFTYSFYPHCGDYYDGQTVQQGYLLNQPLKAEWIGQQEGLLKDCYSFISADCENVVIETIKKAEDEHSIIMRMYETYNRKSFMKIKTGFQFKEVYLCDLMENNIEKLSFRENEIELGIRNFEIVTLKFVV